MENNNLPSFDLYDDAIKSSITFESESDALFAAFCLGDQLRTKLLFPPRIIDAFIAFLKHPCFHADQLSFKNTKNLTSRITQYRRDAVNKRSRNRREAAVQRREIALKRPMRWNYGNILAGNIPRAVLELVSEELTQSAKPPQVCDGAIAGSAYRTVCLPAPNQSALRNACLVHSSWKATVQRFLGHYTEIRNNADVYGFLASPLMGPTTRQLCYHLSSGDIPRIHRYSEACRDSEEEDGSQDYSSDSFDDEGDDFHEEQARNLSHVLSVCTGLRVLRIDGHLYSSSTISDPLNRIAQLQNLEVLSLDDSSCSESLLNVCTVLPNIRKLKSLMLCGFESPKGQVIPPWLDKLSPPSSLTDVDVDIYDDCEETEVLLSWLFRPRETYSVLSTALDPNALFDDDDDFNSIPSMMHRVFDLASRSLESIIVDLSYNRRRAADMASFLSTFTRLRDVRIVNFDGGDDWIGLDWMPPNIEKLTLVIDAGSQMLYNKYQHIEAGIRKLSYLRSLYIDQDPKKSTLDDQTMQKDGKEELDALKLYCAQNGIEFGRGRGYQKLF